MPKKFAIVGAGMAGLEARPLPGENLVIRTSPIWSLRQRVPIAAMLLQGF
ncbi:hypothetical protein [Hyphomicrobium sp.]|nr:hypothetical protein [Hyphomicrobium sp.]MBY0560680.1 hypothetical protein [Hyphomicrobium sp.]